MKRTFLLPPLVAFLFAISCNTSYKATTLQYSSYRIQHSSPTGAIAPIIQPYADSIHRLMNVVIGYNETLLEGKRQAHTLGYFITDAYLEMAKQKIDPAVDAAFMNTGGVRLPELPSGAITQGKIYELMPFDNLMVIMKLKGSVLKQYLDTLAVYDGILESGLSMQVINKKAYNILVGGKAFDPHADYTIVLSDYVVMNSNLLRGLPRRTNGYLLRDAIIDYVKLTSNLGKKIRVVNPDRVIYVN